MEDPSVAVLSIAPSVAIASYDKESGQQVHLTMGSSDLEHTNELLGIIKKSSFRGPYLGRY